MPKKDTRGPRETINAGDAVHVFERNIYLLVPDTEYVMRLPRWCVSVEFRARINVAIRYAWSPGRVAAPVGAYNTLAAGAEYFKEDIDLENATLYFASSEAGVMIEVEAWVAWVND